MKRLLSYLCILFLSLSVRAQDLGAITAYLEGYLWGIAAEDAGVKSREFDYVISTCTDSTARQVVAIMIYNHFIESKIMGDEAVAIHIYDNWFAPGKVSFRNPVDAMNAKLFADFNRSSLIGMAAPEIVLEDINAEPVEPLKVSKGRWKVLYFYDTSCSSCKIESAKLRAFVAENSSPVDFYAIYAGDDEAAWARYRATQLAGGGMTHLWDPGMDSDFQRKYGILQTPGMFLIDPSGVIRGRKLDTEALRTLLAREFSPKEYVYAGEESKALFDELFSVGEGSAEDVVSVADYIAAETLAKGDSLTFRHISGDLLYWLSSQKGKGFKEGTLGFIEKYILPFDTDPEIASLAGIMHELLSKTPIGSVVPSISLHGELRRKPCLFRKAVRTGRFDISKLGGKTSYIVFYTAGCGSCEELLASAPEAASRKGTNILLVDMDELFSSYPDEARAALEAFDLSSLPFVISLDGKGTVTGRYLSGFD